MASPPQKKEVLSLTTELAKNLIKAFPQYKGLSEQDFLDMLDKISAVETQDKNIYQLKGGPGRGYYQMELESAPVAYDRALNIQKELKAKGIDLPKLPRYNQDFTKLTKDEQAFYTLTKMVGAAGAKRLQGQKGYFLNPKDSKKMWLELHWAGKDVDKPARIKHWEETHGKEALVPQKIKTLKQEITKPTPQPTPQVKKVQTQVEQEIEQPDLHPAGPEKTTLSAPPMLSDKRVKQLSNAKFVPNPIGIPIFTEKGTFAWDKPPGELDILLHGRPGPTMRRAQAVDNAKAVQPPTYAQGGKVDKYKSIPRTGLRYPKIVTIPPDQRSNYDPTDETIYLAKGEDPTVLQHEMFHHWQNLNNKLSVGPVAKAPMMAESPGGWYNRRQADIQDASSKFLKKNPSFVNVPFNLLYSKEVEPAMYHYPEYVEGEAEEYQNYVKAGGEQLFPQYAKGGLIKRKDGSYSKRGLWDNIRANRGSKKKPTKEMLRQERKIRAAEKKEDGGPVYNWIPPNYPRVGARNEQGGWLDQYADGGDVPHDYMYSQGNVSSYRPGTSIHPIGMTNVPDSPCGPGFTIQYDETGNPVCMPIAELVPSAPTAPTAPTVLAGANEEDYRRFNSDIYNQRPLETYSVERTTKGRDRKEKKEREERYKPIREEKQAVRKAIKASSLHRRPFLPGVGQFFRDVKERCFGEKCYKFENGSWVTNSSIPTPTTPSYYPAGPDRTLTNYQMGTPKAPMYAHGATVWNKRLADEQMSAAYVIGPDTKGTQVKNTYPDRMSGAENTTNYKIGDYIPTGMDYKSPAAGTYDYNKDVQPYYTMRLHAPDTRRMAYGGYVPMYKKGGFLSTLGDIGLGVVDSTLSSVGSVTGIKSMQDMIDEDQYANDKFDDVAGFAGKVAGTALKVIPVTAPFAAAAGAVGTVANKALKIDEKNYDPTKHTSSWDKWGSGIEAVGGIASMAMGNVSGAAGAANTLSKAAQTANTITKGANLVNAGMGLTQGLGQGQIDFNSLMGLYGGIQGLQGSTTPSITKAKHGGHITKKYNPPGLRWQQLNPGVSAPEGIYTGPTTQRGITFADGGDTSNSVRESTYVQPVYKDRIIDQNNPVKVANSLLKKYDVKVDSTSNVLKDIGLPSEGYYNPITRTIHYKNPNVFNNLTPEEREYFQTRRYLNMIGAEIPHAIQSDSLGVLPFLGKIAYEGIQNPTHSRYDTEGTLEHHAHRILQPELNKKIFNSFTFSPMIERMRRSAVSKKADGGDVLEVKPMLAAGPSAAINTDPRQPKLGVVGMGYAGGKYNPYIQGKAGIQGGSLEAGVSPYFKMDRNFILNPSLGGGVSTAGLYGKAGLTGMYNLPNNLNFDLYGSAEYMRDSRGNSLPIELGLAWSDTSPLLRTGVSYDPLQKTAGFSVNVPLGAERNLFNKSKSNPKSNPRYQAGNKKANGGWLDSYEEGGEVDITKPYLNPATVQATLASANKPVTNTLGRVISTPASREKERREKIIAKDESKYSVEDYKKGIQEPGLEDATLEAIDALSMLSGAGYLGKKGVELGIKEIGKGVKNLIYKGVDPMFYNPSEKIKSFVPNLLSTEKDKIKRIEKIMRDSEVRGSYRKAHNRLDAWRVGLGLPQKYNTFKKTGENTFAINPELFRLDPDAQQSIIAHVKAFNLKDKYLNNIITSEQYEKGLVSINKKMHDRLDDRFSARWIKEQNIPFQPKAIVERKGDKGFSMYDQDRYAGVMGGFRWDIEDLPSNKIKLTAKDTWDLYPFEKRGATKFSDLTSLERQKELNKGYIPTLKNVEVLKLVGGKPYNIENTFIIDKYKQGGWLDNL